MPALDPAKAGFPGFAAQWSDPRRKTKSTAIPVSV